MKLKPLEQFICDQCNEVILSKNSGILLWDHQIDGKIYGFKIVHKIRCDFRDKFASMPLEVMTGNDGLNYWLSFMSLGPLFDHRKRPGIISDYDEFVDTVRRLQLPYYEEARQYFKNNKVQSEFSGSNEIYPYMQRSLKEIIGIGLENLLPNSR